MKEAAVKAPPKRAVLSLAQLLTEQPAAPPPGWIEPGLLPPEGILIVGGEPKVGKSLLVANLALVLAAGKDRTASTYLPHAACGLPVRTAHAAVCGASGVDAPVGGLRRRPKPAGGYPCRRQSPRAPQGLNHFLNAARQAAAEVIVLDPLYSTHDQDENDTRSMAALCLSLLRLRDASKAALIVVHHVRKTIGREEIGSAFRGSSALHAVGDSYLLLHAPFGPSGGPVELRFQFRYAAPPEPGCYNWIRRRCVFPPLVWRPLRLLPRAKRWHRNT